MKSTKKTSILIVEDDKVMSQALALKFERQGFEVTTCYNGQEAIDVLNEREFDSILLDLVMPLKDGFGVMRELGDTKNKGKPVTVLTSMGEEEKLDQARRLGADRCYVKTKVTINEVVDGIKAKFA